MRATTLRSVAMNIKQDLHRRWSHARRRAKRYDIEAPRRDEVARRLLSCRYALLLR